MPGEPETRIGESIVQIINITDLDCYECSACGYVYEPVKGDNRGNIAPNTDFPDLPNQWRCPVCGVPKNRFQNIGRAGKASGFKENLKYGLGVNTLTPGQKNLLIFGSLLLAVLFFLSLYGLG
ncbi:MAG: rubredoxin [Synechococcales bacterium]|nr:rubredoxin [Synechococcales bacterium]